jgi:hypothetical protein
MPQGPRFPLDPSPVKWRRLAEHENLIAHIHQNRAQAIQSKTSNLSSLACFLGGANTTRIAPATKDCADVPSAIAGGLQDIVKDASAARLAAPAPPYYPGPLDAARPPRRSTVAKSTVSGVRSVGGESQVGAHVTSNAAYGWLQEAKDAVSGTTWYGRRRHVDS